MTTVLLLAALAFLGYRVLWHRLHHLPRWTQMHVLQLSGRIAGGQVGLLELELEQGQQLDIRTAGAQVIAWPAPGAWRFSRSLRVGDPVTVLASTDEQPLQAVRIIRGAWPLPPLPRLSSAVVGIVLGICLLQIIRSPVSVEREVAPPSAAAFLLDTPDVVRLHAAARQLAAVNHWAGGATEGTGQAFLDYVGSAPNQANGKRRYLYLQPIGPFGSRQDEVVRLTARFLARYFCLPVRVTRPMEVSAIPEHAQRLHPEWGNLQLLSSYLMHNLLRWHRPDDAAGYLGITPVDIWPGEGWEAVYGQASLAERVGVVSMFRNGVESEDVRLRLALLRTIKVAAHETGHMFSMKHCANRSCLMSGHNDREEADLRFPVLCPDCLAKLLWATRCDPVQRYASLAAFCHRRNLTDEAELFARLMAAAADAWGRSEPQRLAMH